MSIALCPLWPICLRAITCCACEQYVVGACEIEPIGLNPEQLIGLRFRFARFLSAPLRSQSRLGGPFNRENRLGSG